MVVGLEVVFYLSDINHSNQNPGYLNNSWSYQSVIDKKQTTKRRLRIVNINMMTIEYDNHTYHLSSYEITIGTMNKQLAKVKDSRNIY